MRPKIDVRYYRDPSLPGIDICRVDKSRHCFPPHFHDDLYIASMIVSGHCYCLGKGRQEEVSKPGTVTLLNPGQIHTGAPADDRPLSYALCYFSIEAMAGMAGEQGPDGAPEFTAAVLNDPMLSALMRHLFTTMMTSQDSLEKEAVMVAASHLILSRYGAEPRKNQGTGHHPLQEARELLSSHLDLKLSLGQVAQSVGLSRYHFLRTFKEQTGISPHLYRILKRVEAARGLLSRGMPSAQVALETGFTDQSHFSNTFRRYVGATPRQYLAGR